MWILYKDSLNSHAQFPRSIRDVHSLALHLPSLARELKPASPNFFQKEIYLTSNQSPNIRHYVAHRILAQNLLLSISTHLIIGAFLILRRA